MATIVNEKEVEKETAEVKSESVNLLQFLQEVKSEYSKISWPSKEQVTREFFSVIVLVFVITGIIFVIDKILEIVVNFFNGRLFL